MTFIAVFMLCQTIQVASLHTVAVERQCDYHQSLPFATLSECRAHVDFIAGWAKQPGRQLLMGTCARIDR